jgi:hypothetical protein
VSGLSQKVSSINWGKNHAGKQVNGVRFNVARGMSRSEALRKCLKMIRSKEPGTDFECFTYDHHTGKALAIRKK